jgi:uracil-DNA glycosylase family 4
MSNFKNWGSKPKEEVLAPQPDILTGTPPSKINHTRTREGVLYVAGEGSKTSKIMFVATSLFATEAQDKVFSTTGRNVPTTPRYLRGPAGTTFVECMLYGGLDVRKDCYYTAICKWLLPKENRTKPTKEQIKWGEPALRAEIAEINPDIIVCLGKPAFDLLCDQKLAMDDARGGWFYSKEYNARIYLMDDVAKPSFKPEFVPVFCNDSVQILRMADKVAGRPISEVALDYRVIDNTESLKGWVQEMQDGGFLIFSLDCEWGGLNHVDGNLRSVQFAWAAGCAVYLRLMDDKGNYAFSGASYKEVGDILKPLLDRPDVKYVGHHISADLPWIHVWLGLEWYEKVFMDTEFALQCCDEYEELSLEKLALKYTDLGKYDIDLILWKKKNKQRDEAGYAFIPDDILIPYALRDVDVVIRSYPHIMADLMRQNLLVYYHTLFNPFVTDVFTSFVLLGLPMDTELMDSMRNLYTYCRDRLDILLQKDIYEEAQRLLVEHMSDPNNLGYSEHELLLFNSDEEYRNSIIRSAEETVAQAVQLLSTTRDEDAATAWELIKQRIHHPSKVAQHLKFFEHLVDSKQFNIRSSHQMRRWLFDIKKLTPIKTTSNKAKGLPSVSWDRVAGMNANIRALYQPSTDRQSLTILAETHQCHILQSLLRLNSIGNICKAFLKEPDVDEEGNVTKENGLHFFLCADGAVHCQYSTTETGRPRAWKPNCLNWPKYISDGLIKGVQQVLNQDERDGILPEGFRRYLNTKIPSLRSCVKAPEGWCFVESDYQTAEVRGLAFISGDDNLIKIMTQPDEQFGIDANTGKQLRLKYDHNCGIPVDKQDPKFLTDPNDSRLKRKADGQLVHPSADLHWSLAEMMYEAPRETLDKDIHRAAAKVGNFSSMYGATATSLERKIEQDTGRKPETGTGDRILMALARRQPVATNFLISLEDKPVNPGYLRAASGRLRHFATHSLRGAEAFNANVEKSLLSALGREARNFYMQNSVADTSARAGKWLLHHYITHGMKARPLVILYDSVVTLCPLEERHEVAKLHQKYMCDNNAWNFYGSELKYPIDTDFSFRWSTPATAEEKKILL